MFKRSRTICLEREGGSSPSIRLYAVHGKIPLAKLDAGGYDIRIVGKIPSGHQVMLTIGPRYSPLEALDITGHYRKEVLPDLLEILARDNLWATDKPRTVDCQAWLSKDGQLLSASNIVQLPCPVEPYVGQLDPVALGEAMKDAPYIKASDGGGRTLTPVISDRFYFKHGGLLETNPKLRGFDCITYVGSAYGVQSKSAYKNGAGMSAALGGVDCSPPETTSAATSSTSSVATATTTKKQNLNKATAKQIRDFFANAPDSDQTFLLYVDSHTVLVINGDVHEFHEKPAPGGYRVVSVDKWPTLGHGNTNPIWTLKKIPA